jgi:hypothetical protein
MQLENEQFIHNNVFETNLDTETSRRLRIGLGTELGNGLRTVAEAEAGVGVGTVAFTRALENPSNANTQNLNCKKINKKKQIFKIKKV